MAIASELVVRLCCVRCYIFRISFLLLWHSCSALLFINIGFSHQFPCDSHCIVGCVAPFIVYLNAELSIGWPPRMRQRERERYARMKWALRSQNIANERVMATNNKHWLNENGLRLCSYYVLFILIVMSIVFFCAHHPNSKAFPNCQRIALAMFSLSLVHHLFLPSHQHRIGAHNYD